MKIIREHSVIAAALIARSGFNGPFRGELGDALEGSVRTIGMIKWPGKISPRASNEMVSVHDFFPTFASITEFGK